MVALQDISEIKIGFPGQPEEEGNLLFLQVRQFNDDGNIIPGSADYTKLDEKSGSHLLKEGDVLFVGKGNRLFAWCYKETTTPTVASSNFFVLRPNIRKVHPEYLAAILNAPQTKAAFQQLGAGTNIFSIRKSELGAFRIPLPLLEKQEQIAHIANLHKNEVLIINKIIIEKQNLYRSIIAQIFK